MFELTDHVIIVTGGSGGLGQAVVAQLAAAGARLIVPDRQTGRLPTRFPVLAGDARHWLADGVDIGVDQDLLPFVIQAAARFGRIDALVNAVGGYQAGTPPHETDDAVWAAMLEMNMRLPLRVARAVVPTMIDQGRGRIVNIGSRDALRAGANSIAYSASKAALARITESFAAAYKGQGITCNAILPGTIDTAANRAAMPKADTSKWVTPAALATVIHFLLSDASAPINGALIPAYGRG